MKQNSAQMTLLYACSRGYDNEVDQLLNKKTIAERDEQGNTPLRESSPTSWAVVRLLKQTLIG